MVSNGNKNPAPGRPGATACSQEQKIPDEVLYKHPACLP